MKDLSRQEQLFHLARERFDTQNYQGAIEAFKKLLQEDFKELDAHFFLALAYEKDQQHELAIEHLTIAQKGTYKDETILKHLAFNFYQLGNYKQAIYYLQKSLHVNQDDHEAYAMLAQNYKQQKAFSYAKKVLLEAIAIAPKVVFYYIELAKVFIHLQAYDDAVRMLLKALALEQSAATYRLLGGVYEQMTLYDKALDAYDKALKYEPNDALALNNKAVIYFEQGKIQSAQSLMTRVRQLAPNNINFEKNYRRICLDNEKKLC